MVSGTRAINTASGQTSANECWFSVITKPNATSVTITTSNSQTADDFFWEVSNTNCVITAGALSSQPATTTPSSPSLSIAGPIFIASNLHPSVGSLPTGIHSGNPFTVDSLNDGFSWAHLITSTPGSYFAQWDMPSATYAANAAAFGKCSASTAPVTKLFAVAR